jgi:chromosome segregation ATPase
MTATLEELERRVSALEKAQNENTVTLKWVAGTLAQVKALADDHTERLQRIEQDVNGQSTRLDRMDTRFDKVDGRLDHIERDVKGLREEIPGLVTDAVREGLRNRD